MGALKGQRLAGCGDHYKEQSLMVIRMVNDQGLMAKRDGKPTKVLY